MTSFIGREQELKLLTDLWQKKTASFVICKGRRRIGKSRLIQEFGKTAKTFLEFQGLPPQETTANQDQLNAFVLQLSKQTKLPKLRLTSWAEAFSLVNSILGKEKTVLFLDEVSWMGKFDKNFSGYLKIAWDTEWKKHPNLIVVLCGSVSSWIEENILNNTGFLGRVSLEMTLQELSLSQCNQFWETKENRISSVEKLKLLSVIGGVPRYLEEINIRLSAEENIKRLCFTKEGILFSEFDQIFTDVFSKKAQIYKEVVGSLVLGKKTLSEISQDLQKEKSGHLSQYLQDLVLSGFIAADQTYSPKTAKQTRTVRYRLKDNYLRFYLKYIEPRKNQIQQGLCPISQLELEFFIDWETIMGFQFENLILNHLPEILPRLSINPNSVKSASPYYQKKTKQHQACQIDLLIQTKYTVYICEIKFRKKIDKEIIKEVQKKVEVLSFPKNISVRPVLIYSGELEPSLQKEDYFDELLSFSDLLKSP